MHNRYQVRAITSPQADQVADDSLFASADLAAAQQFAVEAASAWYYGVAVMDTETGALDVGFGFGVPAPDDE